MNYQPKKYIVPNTVLEYNCNFQMDYEPGIDQDDPSECHRNDLSQLISIPVSMSINPIWYNNKTELANILHFQAVSFSRSWEK